MKKTLLSLALVAFASASVASVNLYSAESSVGSTSVSVSGSQAFNYSNTFTKVNHASNQMDDKYTLSKDTKTVKYELPTKFGLNVNFEDANKLAYAFSTQVKHNYKFSQDFMKAVKDGKSTGDYKAGSIDRKLSGFDFSATTLSVSYPMYGTLTLGYMADTAADSNFGGSSDLGYFLSAYELGDQDYSINYEIAPSLVDGLDLAVSYATQDSSARSHVVGLNTSFEIFGNTVALDYALTVKPEATYTDDKNKEQTTRPVLNSVDLSYSNTMLEGLEGDVDAALSYLYDKSSDSVLNYSAGLEVSYSQFTFFTPYAGVSYLGTYKKVNVTRDETMYDDNNKIVTVHYEKGDEYNTNTLGTYLGASTSYTYANVTGKLYGEVGYYTDLSNTKKSDSKTTYNDKNSAFAYRVGVKFSF